MKGEVLHFVNHIEVNQANQIDRHNGQRAASEERQEESDNKKLDRCCTVSQQMVMRNTRASERKSEPWP